MSGGQSKKRNGAGIFRALIKGHNASSMRAAGLILFGVSIFTYAFAIQGVKMTPTAAILYSLGGTIPQITDSLSVSLQILPVLIALLIWGKYLNNELCFRCQMILPKCQSVSIWYISLLAGMGLYSAVLAIIGLLASGLGGLIVQEVFYRFGIIDTTNFLSLTECAGSQIPLESLSNVLLVFVLFFLRIFILLLVQFVTWLISGKPNAAIITTLFFAAISLFSPKLFYLPVGGTMFFGSVNERYGAVTGLAFGVMYLLLFALTGWLYCKKTDWLMKFNH